jgi:DHA1 family tetracycline resistance protein-like MFS transporter
MHPQSQSTTMGVSFNSKALMIVLVMVFLSIAGYGIMIPVAPFLIARYVSDPTRIGITVGLLTTLYAVCQFLAAPGLGAIGDRFGRRPILLLCLLGSASGFLLLGIGGALWVLFLGRIIDGLTGANSSVIMAYVADITPSQARGKYFGLIGAIEGLGLVLVHLQATIAE